MAPRGTRPAPFQFVRDAVQVLLAALAGALLLKSVVLGAVYVPSRSMEGTLLRGDYLLVNKLLYGARISGRVPFLGQLFPPFRLPGLGEVRRGDVIVFELPPGAFPGRPDVPVTFVKRCVALPGDDVRVEAGRLLVNGDPVAADALHGRAPAFGPVRVPRAGDEIVLVPATYGAYERLLRTEGHAPALEGDHVLLDGEPATTYTVRRDYLFVLGDNLEHSYDSRMWGFLPEENVEGSAMLVYWSVDPAGRALRWGRVGTGVR